MRLFGFGFVLAAFVASSFAAQGEPRFGGLDGWAKERGFRQVPARTPAWLAKSRPLVVRRFVRGKTRIWISGGRFSSPAVRDREVRSYLGSTQVVRSLVSFPSLERKGIRVYGAGKLAMLTAMVATGPDIIEVYVADGDPRARVDSPRFRGAFEAAVGEVVRCLLFTPARSRPKA